MAKNVKDGFEKATTGNLPFLSVFAVFNFINTNINSSLVETPSAKLDRSSRKQYGDQSIGYVQIRRKKKTSAVEVWGVVTPEHKINTPGYDVYAWVDESSDTIVEASCLGCAASRGGCKHVVAFLFWLHRRSEEPSPTEVASYWKKSTLASLRGEKKFLSLKAFCGDTYQECPPSTSDFVQKLADKTNEQNVCNMLTSMSSMDILSIHMLHVELTKNVNSNTNSSEAFLKFARENMTVEACKAAEKATRNQSDSKLWYELRYGRITASTVYEAAHCSTEDGALVNKILGAKSFMTKAMQRAKDLEEEVFFKLKKQWPKIVKCGLLLNPGVPIFGASPDGLGPDFVIEIKCPKTKATFKNYVSETGVIAPKFIAQINLQMFFADVKKGMFILADPEFEKNQKFTTLWVNRDEQLIDNLIRKSSAFWSSHIYKFINK